MVILEQFLKFFVEQGNLLWNDQNLERVLGAKL